jgi:hypothetical protein
MDLKTLILGPSAASAKFTREFDVKIERKTSAAVVHFDAKVKGHFVAKGGKPDFVAEEIHVVGIPEMNLRTLFPRELKGVRRHALSVEYPKMLGKRVR